MNKDVTSSSLTVVVTAFVLLGGCSGDRGAYGTASGTRTNSAGAATCHSDCSSAHATCFNNCNADPHPAACSTGCGRDQLTCQLQCETLFPLGNASCRSACSSFHSTCSNGCNSDRAPGVCQTGCAREQLTCQKSCETIYPQTSDASCRSDCSSFHSSCFNGCNSDRSPASCQTACSNQQLACQKDCGTRYAGAGQ